MSKIKRTNVAKDFYRVDLDDKPVGFVQVNRNSDRSVQSFLLCDANEVGIKIADAHSLPDAAKELVAAVAAP